MERSGALEYWKLRFAILAEKANRGKKVRAVFQGVAQEETSRSSALIHTFSCCLVLRNS